MNDDDYVSLGLDLNEISDFQIGRSKSIDPGMTKTIWDVDAGYTYLTQDTQLYVSSTSAADTDVLVTVINLDEDFNRINMTATTNGQNQVALSSNRGYLPYIASVASSSSAPVGEIYIAEQDTLTGGVPDTQSKIKAKIPLSGIDSGTDYASEKISHTGIYPVENGYDFLVYSVSGRVGKDQNADVSGWVKPFGGQFVSRNPIPVYQNEFMVDFDPPLRIFSKSIIEFRAESGSIGTSVSIHLQGKLVKI